VKPLPGIGRLHRPERICGIPPCGRTFFGSGVLFPGKVFLPIGSECRDHVDDVAPDQSDGKQRRKQAGEENTAHAVDVVNGNRPIELALNHHGGYDKAEIPGEGTFGIDGRQRREQGDDKIDKDRIADEDQQISDFGLEIFIQRVTTHQREVSVGKNIPGTGRTAW
jgi:hypothetical protein